MSAHFNGSASTKNRASKKVAPLQKGCASEKGCASAWSCRICWWASAKGCVSVKGCTSAKGSTFAKGCASPKGFSLQKVAPLQNVVLCKWCAVAKDLPSAPRSPCRHNTYCMAYTFNRTVQSGHPVKSLPSMFYVAWQDYSGIGRPFFIMFPDSPSVIYSMAGGIYLVPWCNNTIQSGVCCQFNKREHIFTEYLFIP